MYLCASAFEYLREPEGNFSRQLHTPISPLQAVYPRLSNGISEIEVAMASPKSKSRPKAYVSGAYDALLVLVALHGQAPALSDAAKFHCQAHLVPLAARSQPNAGRTSAPEFSAVAPTTPGEPRSTPVTVGRSLRQLTRVLAHVGRALLALHGPLAPRVSIARLATIDGDEAPTIEV